MSNALCTIIAGLLVTMPCYAKVIVNHDVIIFDGANRRQVSLIVTGEIEQADVVHFVNLKKQFDAARGNLTLYVTLDSTGGDVSSSLKIARLVQGMNGSTYVSRQARCLSSCVFVLSGGIVRTVDGQVGIHRPYMVANSTNLPARKKVFDEIESEARALLKSSGVDESLWDYMVAVPPEKIHLLSDAEVTRYRVRKIDVAAEDALDASNAAIFGVSKQEYLALKAHASTMCEQKSSRFSNLGDSCPSWTIWELTKKDTK